MTQESKSDKYRRQKAYRQTLKGQFTEIKYERSQKGRKRKTDWAHRQRLKVLADRANEFIDTYGDVEKALSLLDEREQEVIVKIYGLDGNLPIKQKDIAKQWGTSGQWITEVKQSAIAKLEAAKLAKAEASEQDQNSSPEAQREET